MPPPAEEVSQPRPPTRVPSQHHAHSPSMPGPYFLLAPLTVLATPPLSGRSISISTTSPSMISVSSLMRTPMALRKACGSMRSQTHHAHPSYTQSCQKPGVIDSCHHPVGLPPSAACT